MYRYIIVCLLVFGSLSSAYAGTDTAAIYNNTRGLMHICTDTGVREASDSMQAGDTFSYGSYNGDVFTSIQSGAETWGQDVYDSAYLTRNLDTAEYGKYKDGKDWVLWVTNDALDYRIIRKQIVEVTSYWEYYVEVK
jgi:hypothetical protein